MGSMIGPYELRGELGRGAMAVVWRAFDTKLERMVALKEPLIPSGMDPSRAAHYRKLLIREACIAAKLNHPGIVSVYAADEYGDRPVIAMELLDGATLDRVLSMERLTHETTFRIIEQVLEAVVYAHEHGVVHRDIKPQNLFVTNTGVVKLTDFGIARSPGGSGEVASAHGGTITTAGSTIGSPGYMSPEQVLGQPTDERTDVFAVGVVAHELLSGGNPFGSLSGTAITTIMYRIANVDAQPVAALDPTVAPGLSDVISAALRRNPSERTASAKEFLEQWRTAGVALGLRPREVPELQGLTGPTQATLIDIPMPPTQVDLPAASTVDGFEEADQTATVLLEREDTGSMSPEPPSAPPATEAPAASATRLFPQVPPESAPLTAVRIADDAPRRRNRLGAAALAILVVAAIALAGGLALHAATGPRAASAGGTGGAATPGTGKTAPSPTLLTLVAAQRTVTAGKSAILDASVTDDRSRPFAASLVLSRQQGSVWQDVGRYDARYGVAAISVTPSATTVYRIRFDGDASHEGTTSTSVTVAVTRPSSSRSGATSPRRTRTTSKSSKRSKSTIPPWGTATAN